MQAQAIKDKAVAKVKVPPYSIEAEQAVLGGLMLDNSAWDRVSDHLNSADFYKPAHKNIYESLTELAKQSHPFDVVTVAEALKAKGLLEEAGGEVYLFELAKNTPSAANIKAYSDIVRERSVLRHLLETTHEIADHAYFPDGSSSQDILDEAERKIFAIAEQRGGNKGPQSITQYLAEATDRIDKLYHTNEPIAGLSTGFTDFDEMTSGLQAGDLVIVAGRPSMGKTVFGVNIAEHAAIKSNKTALFFSLEMPGEQIAMRMLSSLGRIDQHRIRSGKLTDDDWPRLTSAVSVLSEAKLYVDDTPALSPSDIRSRARRIAREHELGLIVVDYLQLMQVPGYRDNRTLEISEISRSLKGLAKELNIPVIALSQLNRSLESRADRRPIMSDLRESGAIEQDADVITFIYRDEVYNDDSPDKGIAEIIIAKQRNGPIGKVRLTFLGQFTRFDNFTPANFPRGDFV